MSGMKMQAQKSLASRWYLRTQEWKKSLKENVQTEKWKTEHSLESFNELMSSEEGETNRGQ